MYKKIHPIIHASNSQKYDTTNGSRSREICTIITTARADNIHENPDKKIPLKNPVASRCEKSDLAAQRIIPHVMAIKMNHREYMSRYSLKNMIQNIIAPIVENNALIAPDMPIGRTL